MRLALIGTGLIGGSAAWAFQKAGVVDAVTACDISMGAAEKAVSLGIADRATAKVADAVSDADCILVAVPVLAMEGVFAEITEAMRQEAWVTDVGSTRCGVIAVGAKLFRMTPETHDRIFAAVSHLPHVLAYALVDAMAKTPEADEKFRFVGAGFRDFTRIAASSPVMWRDICLANRRALLESLENVQAELALLHEAIRTGDAETLTEIFSRASHIRRTVQVPAKK